jgi:uncharacterized protein YifN (PemK superfamily)
MVGEARVHQRLDEALAAGVNPERVMEWLKFEEDARKEAGLQHPPAPGTLVYCDFGPGMARPEIYKERPAIVISTQRNWQQLCIVVPISTKEPRRRQRYHVELPCEALDPRLPQVRRWAKCDLVSHVSLKRLRGWYIGGGLRIFDIVPDELLAEVREGLLYAIGLAETVDSADG